MIQIGDRAEIQKTITQADADALAIITGHQPNQSIPTALIAAMVSNLLGTRLPGPGTNYLKQRLDFACPAPLGTLVTCRVEVTRLRPDTGLIDLHTRCTDENETVLAEGRALVKNIQVFDQDT